MSHEHQGQAQEKGRGPRGKEEGREGNVLLPRLFLKAVADKKESTPSLESRLLDRLNYNSF